MEHRDELLRLLSGLCEEQLTEAEQGRLEELLGAEEARRLYLQYVDMHAHLLAGNAAGGGGNLAGVDALAGLIGGEAAKALPVSRNGERAINRSERHRGRSPQVLSYAAVAAVAVAASVLVQMAL